MLPWQLQRKREKQNQRKGRKHKDQVKDSASITIIHVVSEADCGWVCWTRYLLATLCIAGISDVPCLLQSRCSVVAENCKWRNTRNLSVLSGGLNFMKVTAFWHLCFMRQFSWAGQIFLLITQGCYITKVCLSFLECLNCSRQHFFPSFEARENGWKHFTDCFCGKLKEISSWSHDFWS